MGNRGALGWLERLAPEEQLVDLPENAKVIKPRGLVAVNRKEHRKNDTSGAKVLRRQRLSSEPRRRVIVIRTDKHGK